jgi:nitrate/nitrite-specific signal transduction histidine kinase
VKHATGVKHIIVSLKIKGDDGVLQVDDDGLGLECADRCALDVGMGLKIMKYRAMLAGGSLDIRGRADGGTTVICRFDPQRQIESDAEAL